MLKELKVNLKRVLDKTLTSRDLVGWCEEALESDKLYGTMLSLIMADIVEEWRTCASMAKDKYFEMRRDVIESWLLELEFNFK